MSNVQSYNALIDRFKAFASGHFILKSFSHGQIDTADLEKFTEYPFMHVVPSNVTYAKGTKTFSFQIVLADLPRDKDDKVEFQREVLSDLQRIAEDLVAEITNHRVLFGDLITVQNVSLEPFLEEFHNTLTGWTISLDLLVPYYWDACSIPAEWNDMFESGSGGTGSILTFIDSITRDEYGNVSLVNDEATPAPNYYYGTNEEGVRGWYLLTDEVGLTCATIGTCQTIIDIEAEIDLLQQDVTDLQADVVAIETELPNKVPYTGATGNVDLGEYELKAGQIEFDTTPTGTAGAAVMRWNDTDGTVDVGLKGGNVTLQVGQESVIRVVNKAGADLLEANYQAVRVRLVSEGGAQGQRLAVVLALADTDADSATTIGLVTETINNNQEGFVTTSGEVRGINTTGSLQGETWVDGDILYLSGTTAGRVTNVKPSAPTHTIIIGYVVYAHANNGKIFVKVDNGYELDELHNVSITSPTDNQALVYESASSLWKNETIDKTFVGLGNVDNTSDANKPISTATQTALNAKQDSLGFTPVPETRTLTINGTTQDLSANRTFTIATGLTVGTTPITSGTVGRVLFEGTGNVLQESANLFWDNVNGRLGIGTASPSQALQVNGNSIVFGNASYLGTFPFVELKPTAWSGQSTYIQAGVDPLGSVAGSYCAFLNVNISRGFTFVQGSSSSMAITPTTRNVLINTTTDAGYKLDVNGTGRIVTSLIIGDTGNPSGSLIVGRTISIGYIATVGANQSFRLGGAGATINTNSFLMSSGGYNNQLGNIGVVRYVVGAAPTSVGANSVTNLYIIGTEAIKLNDGTSSGINSVYNAGIVTVDLSVMEGSTSGNSNVYVGKFAFRFKRYLINGVGTFTDISAVTNLYNSADATLVGTTLTAVANGTDALDLRVTLPATANTAAYRMGANVTITKVNNT